MEATVYIGIKLTWDYVQRTVTLSMPNYVHKALHRFQHILRGGKEYSPHTCAPIQYGQNIQYAEPLDTAEYLSDKDTNLVQQVCVNFFIMPLPSITIFSLPSEIFPQSNPKPQQTLQNRWLSS